jgi:hypothetical protein
MTDQSFEHRCIIVLPPAEVYAATDALNLMALAVRNRDNDGPPDSARPPILRWDSQHHVYSPSDFSVRSNDAELRSHTADRPHETPKQEEPPLIWDDRAERIKSSLIQELYKSVRSGHLNLWNLFCDMVKAPPSNLGDIIFWTATSNIYRSDLIKFCHSQKIGVEFDRVAPRPETQEPFNQHDVGPRKNPTQDISRPPHWADAQELTQAFPAVKKTYSETLKWFENRSSDRKRARGFKEAHIKDTGKQGRGYKTQFDIFIIAKYLLMSRALRPQTIVTGLCKHLGAALEDYKDQYDDFFSSIAQRH